MRIAMIVNSYPPRLGGLEFHIQNLAESLASQGHSVWVVTISTDPGERIDNGVRVITTASHLPIADVISFPGWGARRSITAFLRDNDIDLVSIHTRFFPMSFIGLRAAKRAGIPVIHTEHGSGFVQSKSPIISLGSRIVDLTFGRYVLRHANRVLAVSEQAAAFAHRLSKRPVEVFYNAITPSEPLVEHPDRPTHLVFVGRVVEGKGWDAFLDAIAQLRTRGREVDGELLGGGAQLEEARRRVNELGLGGVVDVPGRVSPGDVRARLSGATLVNPTVLAEGFQTTLLEALFEGGRVVTFSVPGARLLHEQGAPIAICPHRTTESLVETLDAFVADPPPQADPSTMEPWTWPVRAREYAVIAQRVIDATPKH